jgi:cellobiose-specific phosphotransferase system component IIB
MNKVLVICKGTGQSKSFERFMDDYTKKNNLPIEWIYANDKEYLEVIEGGDVKVAIISPEVVLVEAQIKATLESKNTKPADFGLKRVEKFMPDVEKYIV